MSRARNGVTRRRLSRIRRGLGLLLCASFANGLCLPGAARADLLHAQWPTRFPAEPLHPAAAASSPSASPETPAHAHGPPSAATEPADLAVAHARAVASLAKGDALGALAHLSAVSSPPRGRRRVETLLLRAQALAALGRFADAWSALDDAAAADPRGTVVPRWTRNWARVALARDQWPRTPPGPERARIAERGVEAAASLLSDRRFPHRPLAALARVEFLHLRLADATKRRRSHGRRLAAAADRFLRSYPNAPRAAEVALWGALGAEAAGKHAEALTRLRAVHLRYAGSPVSQEAERRAAEIARATGRRHRILSRKERLAYAVQARRNRWYEASRRTLDALLAEPDLPPAFRRSVLRERAYTAYRQRDYARCAADLATLRAHTASVEPDLLRCYERAHQYDEALAWLERRLARKRGRLRAGVLWTMVELSFRAGRYDDVLDRLEAYEKQSRGRPARRALLRGLSYLHVARYKDAAQAFADLRRLASGGRERRRATYLLARALLATGAADDKREGASLMASLAADDPLDYYGLWARTALAALGHPLPPLPPPERPPLLRRRPSLVEALPMLDAVAADHADALPQLARARGLAWAGRLEDARRELREAVWAYRSLRARMRGGRLRSPATESLGLGALWHPQFARPRARAGRSLRRRIRDPEADRALRRALTPVLLAFDLPYEAVRIAPSFGGDADRFRRYLPAYREAVETAATEWGLPPTHLWALMYTESRFRRFVVSPVGARGAVQIMPYTARRLAERLGMIPVGAPFDPDRLYDLRTNLRLAAYYLAELAVKFHGQFPLAYAAYNGGPDNVARWVVAKTGAPLPLDLFVEEIPFSETRRYVQRVMETHAAYTYLETGTVPSWHGDVDPRVRRNIDF